MQDKSELIALKEFKYYKDMYKIIDFFNKNLSKYGFIFGVSQKNDKFVISVCKEK